MDEATIELPREEATHLVRVLRLSAGDHVRIFNGRGDEWDARVHETRRDHAVVRLGSRIVPPSEPRTRMTLAAAVLKGDKMDDVVRDAVMLGVAVIQPLVTMHTETSLAILARRQRVARWQRVAVASAKQCGRAVVPEVSPPRPFFDALATVNDAVMLVEPSVAPRALALREVPARASITVFVGPEGGWAEEELTRARESGAMLLTLGAQTLRADAVPLIALTALRVRLEDL
jgi:16S rRNA (uracil1498-N3)-methyltransferase